MRVAGAAYLLWLGVQSLRRRHESLDTAGSGRSPLGGAGSWSGLMSNVFNPKVGVFFVTFLPAFVPAGAAVVPMLLLFGAVSIALNLWYQIPLVALADRVTRLASRPRVRRAMDVVTGSVLIGFGLRLATE